MQAILGIDAAWTEREPSGVALVHGEGDTWRVVCVAPSYDTFVACGEGVPVDWRADRFTGAPPNVAAIIDAARKMTTADLSVIAVDMPLATEVFDSRREADRAISSAFGAKGCSTHSPTAARPGPIAAGLMDQLAIIGFPLATTASGTRAPPRAIEVYPHPALLALLSRDYRVPYKVSRSGRYWTGASVATRIANLLDAFGEIRGALASAFDDVPDVLPSARDTRTLSSLKRHEDALDALVCAWVGRRFVEGATTPYGDATAAIWVPNVR